MSKISKDKLVACHGIIHGFSAAAAAAGAGLAQLPTADSAFICTFQFSMTIALGAVFGIRLDKSAAEAAVSEVLTVKVGRSVSQLLIGWIPGIGNITNAVTAAAVTEGLGWVLAEQFAAAA